MNKYGLVVSTSFSKLDELDSFYISFDSPDALNVEEGYTRASERCFLIRHPQINKFALKMGEENLFSLHRVFLSYYEALFKLKDFWNSYACPSKYDLKPSITIVDLEKHTAALNYYPFHTSSLINAKYLKVNEEIKYMEANPFQEYIWAVNLNGLLESFSLEPFEKAHIESKDIFNSSYLIKGAIVKKEISLVLYEWSNIYSFKQPDFIKRISNILEVIHKDIERNKTVYDERTTMPDINTGVYNLDRSINNSWRTYFFGVFNASDLLGAYSRHAGGIMSDIEGINSSSINLTAKQIVEKWKEDKLLPNETQFNHLFKLWYLTTTILVLHWLRLPHFERNEV